MQGTALLTDTVPAHWRFAFSPDTHSLLKPLLYVDMHVHACPVAKSSSTLCDPWDLSTVPCIVLGVVASALGAPLPPLLLSHPGQVRNIPCL